MDGQPGNVEKPRLIFNFNLNKTKMWITFKNKANDRIEKVKVDMVSVGQTDDGDTVITLPYLQEKEWSLTEAQLSPAEVSRLCPTPKTSQS